MDGIRAVGRLREGQTLPLHAGVEHPQDQIEDTVIAKFTLGPGPGRINVYIFGKPYLLIFQV